MLLGSEVVSISQSGQAKTYFSYLTKLFLTSVSLIIFIIAVITRIRIRIKGT